MQAGLEACDTWLAFKMSQIGQSIAGFQACSFFGGGEKGDMVKKHGEKGVRFIFL